jgi:uncharacterized protein YuzE
MDRAGDRGFSLSNTVMKVKYYPDTDTLFIEFKDANVSKARELDEDTMLDVDAQGNICGITIEHAKSRADAPNFSFENAAAVIRS